MGIMKRSSKGDYFEMFRTGAKIALRAAEALQQALRSQDINLEELQQIKAIEHEGDKHIHAALAEIEKAFITPLDTEDMVYVLRGIEAVTDAIDQVSQHIYMMHIHQTDVYIETFLDLVVQSTSALAALTQELHLYKSRSAALKDYVVQINAFEDQGDQNYMTAMHKLFDGSVEPFDILRLQSIYGQLENVLDCLEDVADAVEEIIISAT